MIYQGGAPKYRRLGIYRPELFKLHIALWWLYVTFDWSKPPYRSGRTLDIFMVME